MEVTTDADAAAVASEPDVEVEAASPIVPPHERTLGDTFEEFVIIETGRDPAELRFDTGPGTAARVGRFTRDQQGSSAAVAALFREFEDIEEIRLALGSLSVSLDDPDRWQDILLEVFDTITSAFVPTRVVQPDRLYETRRRGDRFARRVEPARSRAPHRRNHLASRRVSMPREGRIPL